jgi:hypothetical protein
VQHVRSGCGSLPHHPGAAVAFAEQMDRQQAVGCRQYDLPHRQDDMLQISARSGCSAVSMQPSLGLEGMGLANYTADV